MLHKSKYDRFRNDSLTSSEGLKQQLAMSSSKGAVTVITTSPPPCPAPTPTPTPAPNPTPTSGAPASGGEEQDDPTTFCTLIPKIPHWKFSHSGSGFLGSRNKEMPPSRASPAATAGGGVADGLSAVFSSCDSACAAHCSLQAMNRLRGGGGRKVRVEGIKLAGEEWNRKGSFINKPSQGWLHTDDKILGSGVSYIVRYMGCIEVLKSMRSLDFYTRTQVTREAINRLYEAVPGVKGTWKKKVPNKGLLSVLGKSNLQFAGMSIAANISIDGLHLTLPTTSRKCPIIANHHMQSISFASGGDTDTTDYVAYVAKDPVNLRACHILECCEGLAQNVINTIGQAFELRFKQYLHNPPKLITPLERMTGSEESAWGEEEESSEHNYYNSIPGKQPPVGGVVDSRQRHVQPSSSIGATQVSRLPSKDRAPGFRSVTLFCWVGSGKRWVSRSVSSQVRPVINSALLAAKLPGGGVGGEEERLRREPWYHGKIDRKDAERLLEADGDFLVRHSISSHGQYVLTGIHNSQPKHLLLVDPEGMVRTKDLLFDSISHLINYHFENELPIVAAESEVCLRQAIRRKV
uniref:SHC (Src homology 2 domain containing) transforming protein 2 n=1 Tax=Callorhinchus milii TaxID=7868 RepID=A0A4W3H8R1_CALMI